jgi:hypothetical protein
MQLQMRRQRRADETGVVADEGAALFGVQVIRAA